MGSSTNSFKKSHLGEIKHHNKPIDKKEPNIKVTKVEKEKIMNDWGFTKPEIAESMAYRIEKERKRKNASKKSTLSAIERYEKLYKK